MLKSKRRKELEKKEHQLLKLELEINELKNWCAAESPDIGFAMLHLQCKKTDTSGFRERMRRGEFTFQNFKKKQHVINTGE
ncbi:MAG: hypothetical protein RPR40_07985 [Bermanella sp.]